MAVQIPTHAPPASHTALLAYNEMGSPFQLSPRQLGLGTRRGQGVHLRECLYIHRCECVLLWFWRGPSEMSLWRKSMSELMWHLQFNICVRTDDDDDDDAQQWPSAAKNKRPWLWTLRHAGYWLISVLFLYVTIKPYKYHTEIQVLSSKCVILKQKEPEPSNSTKKQQTYR